MRQFGAQDQAQLAEARRIEAARALREQQDREYAAAIAKDLVHQQIQEQAAQQARERAEFDRHETAEKARAKAELDQRVIALLAAIADGTAGAIDADADMLNSLSSAERRIYTRLRNVNQLTHKVASQG